MTYMFIIKLLIKSINIYIFINDKIKLQFNANNYKILIFRY
jgi:hypothetical protein